jgi:DNA polymerase-3 subunit delta
VPTPPALPPLTLVTGDEELLVSRALARLTAAARDADADADVREYATDSLDPAMLLDLATPSLFGERRMVVIRLAAALDDAVRDALLELVAIANEELAVVVVQPAGTTGKKVADACKAAGAVVVACRGAAGLKGYEQSDYLQKFVGAELHGLGHTAPPAVVAAIVDGVDGGLRELAAACSQLCADTGGALDEAAVRRYFKGRAGVTGFTIADRAIEGKLAEALVELRQGMQSGLDPVVIVAALARQLRTVARVASEGSRASADALAAKLGMPAWMVKKAQKQARGWTPDSITRAFDAVASADTDVKGGTTEGALIVSKLRAEYAAERAVRRVADCGAAQ